MVRKRLLFGCLALFVVGCGPTVGARDDAGPNTPPTADAELSPTSPSLGETVEFDAASSTDPNGDDLTYEIHVHAPDGDLVRHVEGDGGAVDFDAVEPGTYSIELTVRDDSGAEDGRTFEVDVRNGTPTAHTEWTLFKEGETFASGHGDNAGVDAIDVPVDRLEVRVGEIRDPEGHETTLYWSVESTPTETGELTVGGGRLSAELPEPGLYKFHAVLEDEFGGISTVAFEIRKPPPRDGE